MIIDSVEYSNPKTIAKNYKRKGICDYKACKAACCRFSIVGTTSKTPMKQYIKGMGFKIERIGNSDEIILEKPCKYLDLQTYKCKRYERRPIPCRQFPIPSDKVYQRVRRVCSYRFESETKEIKMGK